ncbi:hypothetical protein KAU43_05020 [candidate division WOR-3 bacterium]|nr:hypothetical protein [candidate division WOR-3 bacterium]
MGRHGMKYCLLCNPDGNGIKGDTGTEAIGKYFLEKEPNQCTNGWIPVCEYCISTVPFYVSPLPKAKNHPYWVKIKENEELEKKLSGGSFKHDWDKVNLITKRDSSGLYDLRKCTKCGLEIKWRGLGCPADNGCTVEDSDTEG